MMQSLKRSLKTHIYSCTELREDQCQACYTIVPDYTLAGANNNRRVNRPAKVGVCME